MIVLRKGEQQTLRVKVGRLEDGEKQLASLTKKDSVEPEVQTPTLGLTLKELDEAERTSQEIAAEVKGVLVTDVLSGSQAEEKGIKVGEVIVEIGQEAVGTPQEANDRIEALKKEGRKSALVMVSTKTGDIRFVVLRIEG